MFLWDRFIFLTLVSSSVKPKKETTPGYYQYDDNPMHPLCTGYINQESNSETAKNPSDYEPISFHIVPPYLRAVYVLYHDGRNQFSEINKHKGGALCLAIR